jgi:hypothetical protein
VACDSDLARWRTEVPWTPSLSRAEIVNVNELHGLVVSTSASYSGNPRFKFRLGDGYSDMFSGFPQSLQVNVEIIPKVVSWPLPSTLFTINCSLIIICGDKVFIYLLTYLRIRILSRRQILYCRQLIMSRCYRYVLYPSILTVLNN